MNSVAVVRPSVKLHDGMEVSISETRGMEIHCHGELRTALDLLDAIEIAKMVLVYVDRFGIESIADAIEMQKGWRMFHAGFKWHHCTSPAQKSGWDAAYGEHIRGGAR